MRKPVGGPSQLSGVDRVSECERWNSRDCPGKSRLKKLKARATGKLRLSSVETAILMHVRALKVPFLKILFPAQKFGNVFLIYSRAYC